MRLPLTPYGRRETLLYGGLALGLMVLISGAAAIFDFPALAALVVFPAAQLLFTLQFFRDPERHAAADVGDDAILSPADGRVVDVVEVEEPDYIGGKATRVGIFMSPFDCHVNRFPVNGTVERVVHRAGKFLKAYDPRAIVENEASITGIRAEAPGGAGVRVLVRQVAGVAARRIVNPLARGDRAARGERFGMIKLGSRCELYFPREAGVAIGVRPGERVAAGVSVIARFAPLAAGVEPSYCSSSSSVVEVRS